MTKVSDAQSLIGADEALVTYLVGDKETYLWVVRRDRTEFYEIELTGSELKSAVKELRRGLETTGVRGLGDVLRRPFNLTKAYKLYQKILAPAEQLLEGVRHVMVVPDGALQSLPLGVLVTEKPQGAFTDFSGYRQVPWLAKKYALSVLPSVSSLKALRVFAKAGAAKQPFVGFGDPVLGGDVGSRKGVELASLFSRGSVVDVEQLRRMRRLPGTADELKAIAKSLNASKGSVYLGPRATESRVKKTNLSDVRVLAFSTHAIVAGKLKGVAEPGLVLTPPARGTKDDDGYLTASEVAQLKLNADWVILSACNTATSDGTPGAEGLSGLARAFFYAGSRALLVSHWSVESSSATALTTRMFKEAKDKMVGRAGVVRFPRSKFRQNWMALAASLVIGVALGGGSAKFYADQTTENETKLVFRGGEGAREIQHNKVELVEALPSSSALVLRKLEIETRLNKILEEVAGSERIVEKVQVNLARNSKLKVVSTFLSDTQFKNEKLTKCIVTEFSEPGLAHPILFVACRNVAGSWKIVSG